MSPLARDHREQDLELSLDGSQQDLPLPALTHPRTSGAGEDHRCHTEYRRSRLTNVDSLQCRNDYTVATGVRAYTGELTMCPNCVTSIAITLGGAGSAVLLAAAGLRFRTGRAPELTQSNTEETAS